MPITPPAIRWLAVAVESIRGTEVVPSHLIPAQTSITTVAR